jgi:hypothetical protein
MDFHTSFLKILKGEDELQIHFQNLGNHFSKLSLHDLPKTADSVVSLAPILINTMQKPQKLIETNKNYYIANDITTNTIYMCFKNILMIDIDTNKNNQNIDLDEITVINTFKHTADKYNYVFKLYKSARGYHIFCLNKKWEYRNKETIQFMLNHSTDFYYCVYSYIRGFSVRLNQKFYDNARNNVYKEICVIGDLSLIDKDIECLVDKHILESKKYKSTHQVMQNFDSF